MSNLQIANTIRAQLGNRFAVMTGAKDFVGGPDFLQFGIGKGAKNKANKVRITLEESDTYRVEFFKTRGINCQQVGVMNGVYADRLAETFTAVTGMDTQL